MSQRTTRSACGSFRIRSKGSPMTEKYRIESGQFGGQVDVEDHVIVAAPLVWDKFRGQTIDRLFRWLERVHGGYVAEEIPTLADVVLPTYCGCNELLKDIEELEAHVESGCWRKA